MIRNDRTCIISVTISNSVWCCSNINTAAKTVSISPTNNTKAMSGLISCLFLYVMTMYEIVIHHM